MGSAWDELWIDACALDDLRRHGSEKVRACGAAEAWGVLEGVFGSCCAADG